MRTCYLLVSCMGPTPPLANTCPLMKPWGQLVVSAESESEREQGDGHSVPLIWLHVAVATSYIADL